MAQRHHRRNFATLQTCQFQCHSSQKLLPALHVHYKVASSTATAPRNRCCTTFAQCSSHFRRLRVSTTVFDDSCTRFRWRAHLRFTTTQLHFGLLFDDNFHLRFNDSCTLGNFHLRSRRQTAVTYFGNIFLRSRRCYTLWQLISTCVFDDNYTL